MTKLDEVLTRGVAEVIKKESLVARLSSGKKLVIKLGIDPTSPDLHLGHYLVLQKLAEFQNLGHSAVLVIGDFTALVGDPSGRNTKRVALSKEQIAANMSKYIEQAGKIIDTKKAEIVYNSSWFDKLGIEGIMELASRATFAQIMEREEFKTRVKRDNLSLLEILYPLLQAYDSVMLKADVEIGGLDQKLNLIMGRQIQKRYGQKEQDIVMTPLLVGLDGKEKMSKSTGNYIAFHDTPEDMFGKIMSIPDNLVKEYFIYCTRIPLREIEVDFEVLKTGKLKPIDIKKKLATKIVEMYYGAKEAAAARGEFERVIQKGEAPTARGTATLTENKLNVVDFLVKSGMVDSKSEARRLIEQRGVTVDNRRIENAEEEIELHEGSIAQIGKLKVVEVKIVK